MADVATRREVRGREDLCVDDDGDLPGARPRRAAAPVARGEAARVEVAVAAILGVSGYYHDAAAALVVDGKIVAAMQEERFSRVKNDAGLPRRAMEACLAAGGL